MICYVLAMGKQHLGLHVVVGYGIKIFWRSLFITSPDHLEVRIAEQRSARDVKTRKSAGKPNADWLVRERIRSKRSSGSLNCFSFLTGFGITAKSTKCKSAILICLTALLSD